jgi:hypothetical protein
MRIIPRLLILALLISVSITAQPVPRNARQPFHSSVCFDWGPEPEPPPGLIKDNHLFRPPVLSQQPPITFVRQDGTILKHIVPPPEFLVHNFTMPPGGLCDLAYPVGCNGYCVQD